jgi:hypothetical protein
VSELAERLHGSGCGCARCLGFQAGNDAALTHGSYVADLRPTRHDATLERRARAGWPWWAPLVLDRMASGAFSLTAAAKAVGVHRATVHRLRNRDPEFAEALDLARDASLDLIEAKLVEASTKGIPNKVTTTKTYPDGTVEVTVKEGSDFYPVAGFFMLKRWRPEYRESYRAEMSGPEAGPIQIDSLDVIDRQIAELAAELARRGRTVGPRDLVDPELLADGAGDCDLR